MATEHRRIPKEECPHSSEIKVMSSEATTCSQCDVVDHLRQCTSCGQVFCCESHNSHNTKHYQETGHPIIKSHNTPYDFYWCYECKAYLEV